LGAYIPAAAMQAAALTEYAPAAYRPGKPHSPDRLVRCAALRTGNATHRDRQVRLGGFQRALGHGPHHRLADRTELLQIRFLYSQPARLAVVGVGDKTGIEPAGATAYPG